MKKKELILNIFRDTIKLFKIVKSKPEFEMVDGCEFILNTHPNIEMHFIGIGTFGPIYRFIYKEKLKKESRNLFKLEHSINYYVSRIELEQSYLNIQQMFIHNI